MGGWRFSLGLENAVSIRLPGCLCPRDERSQVGMGNKIRAHRNHQTAFWCQQISQNHSGSEAGRASRSIRHRPCSSRDTQSTVPRPTSRCFWRSPRRLSSLWAACGSAPSPARHRELPSAQRELLCSALCLWPQALALDNGEQSLAPSSVRSPFRDPRVRVTRAEQAQRF